MTKILYIAGWGRSGTTLLDNLLGQTDGFVSTGELHHVWKRGLAEGRACGCGLPVTECERWRTVFAAGFGDLEAVDVTAVRRSQDDIHTRHVRTVLRSVRRGTVEQDFVYAGYLRKLYDGIAAATGARVIVDSSKYPTDAVLAAGLPGFEVFVVHMVRDPRAVAFSWQRRKAVQDKVGGELRRAGLIRSTLVWQFYNTVIASTVRQAVGDDHYRLLRYERFAAEPAAAVRELIAFVGGDPATGPAFRGNEIDLKVTHTGSGNPGRFRTGATTLRPDDEWRAAMPSWKRAAVGALAFPTLARFPSR